MAVIQPLTEDNQSAVLDLPQRVTQLEDRAVDLQGRFRRSNSHVLGLLEGVQGVNLLTYLKAWFWTFTSTTDLS
ncbi:hypothetical protein NDU88_003141 [Pleurodeles waltl]|uniref:Uncharacterized protein n=1 Tax=Pleurodeles waltl TaxID=8319 RepID=A0AAV7UD92_PLEWA|nr:hypothetical protein NDU88_003141 [Pleurodeles waltl]